MSWNISNYPGEMTGVNSLVRLKGIELANAMEKDGDLDDDTILTQSKSEAEKWFEDASEEEKEELRKRYPEEKFDEL